MNCNFQPSNSIGPFSKLPPDHPVSKELSGAGSGFVHWEGNWSGSQSWVQDRYIYAPWTLGRLLEKTWEDK